MSFIGEQFRNILKGHVRKFEHYYFSSHISCVFVACTGCPCASSGAFHVPSIFMLSTFLRLGRSQMTLSRRNYDSNHSITV